MNIKGKKIILRALETEDLSLLQRWANDPDIQYMLGGWHFPTNMNDQKKWFDAISCNSNNQRFMIFNEANIAIGMANLLSINFKDGNAEHGLLLDKQFQGKGYGSDVVYAIMNYAFNELRLNRLDTTIIALNEPSLNLFNKCRWKVEGRQKNWYFRKGRYWDRVIVGITKEDYFELIQNNK